MRLDFGEWEAVVYGPCVYPHILQKRVLMQVQGENTYAATFVEVSLSITPLDDLLIVCL
jgi:hypothetical protein